MVMLLCPTQQLTADQLLAQNPGCGWDKQKDSALKKCITLICTHNFIIITTHCFRKP